VPIIYSEKTLNMAGAGRTPAYLAGREQIIANTAQSFETSERTPAYRGGGFLLQREQHH